MTVCYSHEPLIIILVHASNSATWPLLYVVMCMHKRCVYQVLSLSSPSSAPGNETILWAGWTLATKGRVWVLARCFYRDCCVSLCHRYRIAMVVSNQIKCNLRPRLVVFKVKVPHFFMEDELTTEVCYWGIFYCVSIPTRDRHSMAKWPFLAILEISVSIGWKAFVLHSPLYFAAAYIHIIWFPFQL